MIIAVDVMGGDHAPTAIMDGFALAFPKYNDVNFVLIGDEEVVRDELKRVNLSEGERIQVRHASQVVDMSDSSVAALRAKKNSSITVAAEMLKTGEASAIVSAGHTGAAVTSTVVKARMIPGIDRPGIATVFPTPSGPFVLLDAGANVDAKPLHLVQYAIMGEIYARVVLGVKAPRVGVLTIGEEDEKGTDLTRKSREILSKLPINFVGNVEGNDLFKHAVDVVVCDGFVGNVVLKSCEGLAKSMAYTLKDLLKQNPLRILGYLLSRGAYSDLKRISDYEEYGGAPLLGVNGTCIIGHGSSSPKAVMNAIRVARDFVEHSVNSHISERWSEVETEVIELLNS